MTDPESLAVGDRIRALRDQLGWSARELAEACLAAGSTSLTRGTIAKIESGGRRLHTGDAVTLARVFGVPIEEVLGVASARQPPDREPTGQPRTARGGPSAVLPKSRPIEVPRDEVAQVLGGLDSARGPHFWLIVGPPRIGKTTFLGQLRSAAMADRPGWVTRAVDAREQASEVLDDAGALLARMFAVDPAGGDQPETHLAIARKLSKDRQQYLCTLDSAELLPARTTAGLRESLSSVYRLVQQTGNPSVRLAFVVASRIDEDWRRITPLPRIAEMPLGAFGADVVEHEVRDWARRWGAARHPSERLDSVGALIYQLTAGLPALLEPFLDWLRDEEWLEEQRLESQAVFTSLTEPYVRDWLLAADSLFPGAQMVSDEQAKALETAIEHLVRYRFFTRSHLRHYLELDTSFQRRLEAADWQADDLWLALSGMALLARPLDEPWLEFQPAVRRLLFRHFNPTASQRSTAYREGRDYMAAWAARQSGKDRVAGLVETLWQNAEVLRLDRVCGAVRTARMLRDSARELVGALRKSDSYSLADLRSYAVAQIIDDSELHEAIGDADDLADLIDQVAAGE